MLTVAFIGPDGAGKSTVIERVRAELPRPSKVVYMNINLYSVAALLPTTRLWLRIRMAQRGHLDLAKYGLAPPESERAARRRTRSAFKAVVRLAVYVSEESARYLLAAYYRRRGLLVLFDRHFVAEYYGRDIGVSGRLPPDRALHRILLDRVYPRPDLVVCLDAPAEVLFARKGEYTIEALDAQRRRYLRSRGAFPNFVVIDATQPLDTVVLQVLEIIRTCSASESD